jgi:hypothetical protein
MMQRLVIVRRGTDPRVQREALLAACEATEGVDGQRPYLAYLEEGDGDQGWVAIDNGPPSSGAAPDARLEQLSCAEALYRLGEQVRTLLDVPHDVDPEVTTMIGRQRRLSDLVEQALAGYKRFEAQVHDRDRRSQAAFDAAQGGGLLLYPDDVEALLTWPGAMECGIDKLSLADLRVLTRLQEHACAQAGPTDG